jgi:hypothetical protein
LYQQMSRHEPCRCVAGARTSEIWSSAKQAVIVAHDSHQQTSCSNVHVLVYTQAHIPMHAGRNTSSRTNFATNCVGDVC